MKILITSPSLDTTQNVSGISSIVKNIITRGRNEYIHFELGSSDRDISISVLRKTIRSLKLFSKYRNTLKKHKPDLIHMNVPCNRLGIVREYAFFNLNKKSKIKILVHLHGGDFILKKPMFIYSYMLKKILKGADSVIVLGENEKQALINNYKFNSTQILSNSVNVHDYKFKRLEKGGDSLLQVLYLARIENNKGIREIIEAIKRLNQNGYKFKFVVCGEGEGRDKFVDACSQILGDDFIYKGVVFGEEKIEVIKESDILLLPSYFEGLPMALLETMAAGVVPIATSVGSITNVVENNVNGLIISPHDSDALYEALSNLLSDKKLLNLLSENAPKQILKKYDIECYIDSLEKIYKQM